MNGRIVIAMLVTLVAAGCGMFGGGGSRRIPSGSAPQLIAPDIFMNRVWRVVEAPHIPIGTLYVFLSDNTLLITPPTAAAPLLGRWHYAGGGLALIEGGFRYPADIVEAGPEHFTIRVHRPDAAVDVKMVPAVP